MPSAFRRCYNTAWILIGLYIAVAVLGAGTDGKYVADALQLSPDAVRADHQIWRLVTYSFLSSDWLELFMKLLLMFLLAIPVEMVWGTRRFLSLLAATIIGGGLCGVLLRQELVGTWAPLMALMLVYGFLFQESMMSLFLIIPVRVRTFAFIVTALFVASSLRAGREGLAALAGMACGMLYYLAVGYVPWLARAKRAVAKTAAHPGEQMEQAAAARKFDRVRQIYAAVKAGQPISDDDRRFVASLGEEAKADQSLCSPLSFCMDNSICPPCSQIGLCLRRYLETHQDTTARETA